MTALEAKIGYFKEKQQELLFMEKEVMAKAETLRAEFQNRITATESEYDEKKREVFQAFETKKAEYKAELKAAFGVTDGENANILDVVGLVQKAMELGK